ncbi:putative glycolipid-binding domain-containing protein [Streptomyces sp. RLB1-33]|uniref:putative glycolipid-binding domain-containing protein n=1 Tax=Streptomyces mirabilis TaxID=68239 RepID=UPI00143E53BD|nr:MULTISPECIES: putative glycolipid-binding domain-containing protein [Streptomyces]QIY74930.1 putative glycolipid-binding domain-containing protein [Streptomyces sp. RLB1-33]QUW77908.1 putative glycolipid-binding domain-containing protein [Streptomyces mirabilis]
MASSRVITWEVSESKGFETSWIMSGARSLRARGRAVGTVPEPYWISYELDTVDGFVTRRLCVSAETASGTRSLDLRHDGEGHWTADGDWLPDLGGALDCDLGLCPLTNTMPVLRHGLHLGPGEREFLMAWVSVPDLAVRASAQTYTHLGRTGDGGRVRFSSGDHRSDLEFDAEGYVVDYPNMARRMATA